MTKKVSKATPVSIILNIILIINALIVLYPVLFTVSSSLTKSNSLAATSVIPFTDQKDISYTEDCYKCDGRGDVVTTEKGRYKDDDGKTHKYSTKKIIECPVCEGTGSITKLKTKFSFKKPSLYQFRRLLTDNDKLVKGETNVHGTNYKKWYFNTLKIAVLNTIITVFVCTLAGYIFSRFQFTGRKQLLSGMMILQMFPSFIGMVATYVILWKFNALNTLWGLVLVYSAGSIPFNSQLMKGYFDTMSKDIAEAAYIDGASPMVAFVRVILPSVKPQIVFLGLTSFTGPWMDYIFPRMVLRSDDKKTLAVGLYEMINGRSNDNFTMFAAGAILVAVPFAILFMAGQKTLLTSLAGTSGKE
ncbi:MAG: sugar ABC transporter permease [Treponema sp.]|nr:sugar ABC transporter permease [Treponema sp.]